MIDFQGVRKSFEKGVPILDGLSFQLEKGKFSGLLGPSGCGKTTLLRILAGLEHANEGKVTVDGEVLVDIAAGVDVSPERRNIGMVFQNYAVWPHMTVAENIAFPLKIRGMKKEAMREEVEQALEIVKMPGLGKRRPSELSGGQQQRVALARALVQKPRLLLLDEPLSNLDAHLRDLMRGEIRQIQERTGLTAIIVTHDWADAKALCDDVVVMHKGHIEQKGSPQAIAESPSSDFVRKLVR